MCARCALLQLPAGSSDLYVCTVLSSSLTPTRHCGCAKSLLTFLVRSKCFRISLMPNLNSSQTRQTDICKRITFVKASQGQICLPSLTDWKVGLEMRLITPLHYLWQNEAIKDSASGPSVWIIVMKLKTLCGLHGRSERRIFQRFFCCTVIGALRLSIWAFVTDSTKSNLLSIICIIYTASFVSFYEPRGKENISIIVSFYYGD